MPKIDKKKGSTLFVLTLLITALMLVTTNGPTSAGGGGLSDIIHLHGPSVAPIHMHCHEGILTEGLMFPIGTTWHELHPEFCEEWVLTSWIDSTVSDDGYLGFGDQIDMTNVETEEVCWYFVDYMTVTMRLYSEFYDETIYVEYKGNYWEYEPYIQPICTNWTEIWPVYLGVTGGPYHIVYWEDNGDGVISYCDYIVFADFPEVLWHVEEYASDLVLNEKVGDPTCTIWHELYPDCCVNDYHIIHWKDNCDDVLSPCDYVTLNLEPDGPAQDYHVDVVTLTLNLTILDYMGIVPQTDRVYVELNTTYFDEWEWMWWAKITPTDFDWYVVCVPGEPDWFGYPLYIDYWEDNCNGVLDWCDYIELWGPESAWWCHVEEVAVDIIVGPPCHTEDGYKPPFNDYAQSGVPDFDQRQDEWYYGEQWTYCGPTAVANSLWWMDSRFEDHESPPPPEISDSFVMVTRYDMLWDDHDPQNVQPFIEDLAWYMDTDGQRTGFPHLGTIVGDMYTGIIQYLTDRGLISETRSIFEVGIYEMPEYEFIEYEIERCEDVILLLGFWQYQEIEPGLWMWVRIGGHYVTASGVWSEEYSIAISDPYVNNAEIGCPGRVLPYPHTCTPTTHNNATFVSHDKYWVTQSPSPGGFWGFEEIPCGYPSYDIIYNFIGQNPRHPEEQMAPPQEQLPIYTEIEFIITVSPKPCCEVFPGDATGDGLVNVWDLGKMSDAWLSQIGQPNFDPSVDFNFDGYINVWDLGILSDQWLKVAPPCDP